MSDLVEYIVSLKNREDLDNFYEDMETPGGNLYIPDRAVEVANRREISRNTHYYLTEKEAAQIRNDPRVLCVEQLPEALGLVVTPHWTQTGNFEKSPTIDSNDKNWALYRVTNGQNIANWRYNLNSQQSNINIKTSSSGKNVDVVIVDAHINPNHPEFAVNPDGTGGSRVNQFNWFSLDGVAGINSGSGVYDYSHISSNHGTHVAGTAAGNTQGWARDANIYNMEFNYTGTFAPGSWALYMFDYLRAFHKNKSINPITGRRNPTITNHSWGYSYGAMYLASVNGVTYRNVFTDMSAMDDNTKHSTLETKGVPLPYGYLDSMPSRYIPLDIDVGDAISDGVVVISSAGNSFWNMDVSSGQDYNNAVRVNSSTFTHSRGGSPGAATGVICVGNVFAYSPEYKDASSNYGKRVDVWAPGSYITSSVYNNTANTEFGVPIVTDPRDSNYYLASISGTSMASPQVSGVLACYAEQNPNMTNSEALEYLQKFGKSNQISSLGTYYGDYYWFGDSYNNLYLYYNPERPYSGFCFPQNKFRLRASSGQVYPRTKIRKKG